MLAAHDLSSEKELLDLVFSESGVVGGTGNARANEASHCSENEPPPIEIMRVHRSTLPDGAHKSTPNAVDRQPMDIRGEQQETRGRFSTHKRKEPDRCGPFFVPS